MKRLLLLLLIISTRFITVAQNQSYSLLDNLHPVTPTAFQFLKYSEMPVSEYTGVPNITIPLYEINEDGIKVPLNLTYHAGGIRVNQEASWVGLGWDLTVGSIVQQINDRDDFDPNYSRVLPDYFHTGPPSVYPIKFQYNAPIANDPCVYNCDNSQLAINNPIAAYGFMVYTDSWAPINGYYVQNDNLFSNYANLNIVDSEPDIFTANFLGYSIKFMVDWSYNTNHSGYKIVVLNKKGFSVTRNGDVWKIIVPSGEEYDFELKSTVQTMSSTDIILGGGSVTSPLDPSSIIWMLTKIVTKNGKTIVFNYSSTVPQDVYPTFSQKNTQFTQTGFVNTDVGHVSGTSFGIVTPQFGYNGGYSATRIYSKESYINLSSIVFPKGRIDFSLSDRNDILGGKKLDQVQVSANQTVKSIQLNYDYFDATNVGGNRYNVLGATDFGNYPLYRLKLLSIQDNSGAKHTFNYNTTPLPAKNSYALDYWGFYNGQISNTSAVPNPGQFTSAGGAFDWSFLGNTSGNHSANLNYARAGILEEIQYPTAGKVQFTFELNQFDNYWVPDFSTSSNTVSSGNGLRIKSVIHVDANNNQLKRTNYLYSGGKAILPAMYFRQFTTNQIQPFPTSAVTNLMNSKSFALTEINMNGFFSSNPFASVNGIGYSQVTKIDVDLNGVSNGKTVTDFFNNPDLVTTSASTFSEQAVTLPAIKMLGVPENGSVDLTSFYDQQNNLLKKIKNSYANSNSSIYYGARIFGYDQMVRYLYVTGGYAEQNVKPRNIVGYYPIYDFETLLTGSTETNYFGTDNVTVTKSNMYDQYNQISTTWVTNSDQNSEGSTFTYPYSTGVTGTQVINDLISRNRLTDIISVDKSYGNVSKYNLQRTYKAVGNLIVADNDVVRVRSSISIPSTTTYDQYDSNNGNLLQYTVKGVTNSVIWDYSNEYLIAEVKNAPINLIAYTSFEADGKGNWNYSGLSVPDDSAPTGKRAYNLSNGGITATGLDATKTYILSYWLKNGAEITTPGNSAKIGRSANGWTYYEQAIQAPSQGVVSVAGNGEIDELRLYPTDAQMTTYTYNPLIGISSTADTKSNISYYEYDASQRLQTIRDQEGKILKNYCYNYAGQTVGCNLPPTVYSSAEKSGSYARSCITGYMGSSVTYTVPTGTYTSQISQADADQKAQDDVNANGQTYANTHGNCSQATVYARIEVNNQNTDITGPGVTDYTSNTTGDVYIRLYTNPECTQPYTATSNVSVVVAEGSDFYYGSGGGSSGSTNVTFTVLNNTSELFIGNETLNSYHYYEIESYESIIDTYNYSFDIVSNGGIYIPKTTVYY